MSVTIMSAAFSGIEGVMVCVEIDISKGLPAFNIVGLGDTAVKESRERVRAAIINSGYEFPISRITVNLAPADIRKEGAQFDLAIALGILLATCQIKNDHIDKYLIIGELALSGELRGVRGALPITMEGSENKVNKFIIPLENVKECSIIREAEIFPFKYLNEVVNFVNYEDLIPYNGEIDSNIQVNYSLDFDDVVGQESAKRAIEIAAAGNHNIILMGPPGCGKTMLAQCIPTIMPKLTYEEALESTKIYSVSGNLPLDSGLISSRPFRNPHHTSSKISLTGGGSSLLPGEVSMAHNGVLFLDEILEFRKEVLEVLRQPLEERKIKISRFNGSVEYPANIMLVGALNPCPCGYYGSNVKQCVCTDYERKRYINRLSGPLLDRIDLYIFVNSVPYNELSYKKKGEKSRDIQIRVEKAREVQKKRFINDNIRCNSEMNTKLIKKYCKLDKNCNEIIEKMYNKFQLSARSYGKILKISRTIADLNLRENIEQNDIIEALQYRKFLEYNSL